MVACETTDTELRELQNEGMISAHWSFIRDTVVPKPGAGEVVMTKAWVERGLSLPCSEFFLSILNTYGLQPHNICPNYYLLLSNFATLCEGHLGIRPDVKLWQFFFRVKKETKDKAMLNCGSMTFMLRPGRMYPPHDSHESVRYWNAGWFYEKNASVPEIHDGLPKFNNEPPEELASWSFIPSLSLTPILEKAARRISWLVHDGLTGTQLTLSWFTRRIQPLRRIFLPATTSSELENLRFVPRVGVKEAEERRSERKAEKNSELIREKGEFLLKRNADSETIKRQKNSMDSGNTWRPRSTIGTCWPQTSWSHLDILKGAGINFPGTMFFLLLATIARILFPPHGRYATTCHEEEPHLRSAQTGQANGHSSGADVGALDAVSGYDTRIARRIRHDEFYDKAILPADEPLEDELQKERDAEACGIRNPVYLDQLQGCSPRGTQVQRCNLRRG
ncbi:hypothetical protein QYE76_011859 [Lolium multiflorum]|uniref:Transposase (putative) gypsy type domain-containing protein n=1 Tax=Lolium multiflorum TaxID=4521 RepID=A0AAD8X5Q8_LOLMU|nr:hypothetical protein QYE76_011859 [Lolium multiflorum]